jgi:hypothetical protein
MSQLIQLITNTGPSGYVQTLIGNSGGAISPSSGNINVIGDGTTIDVVGTPLTSTLTISYIGATGVTWNDITGTSASMAPNNGYISDNGSTVVQLTLPAIIAQGQIISVAGYGSGGWKILQNSGQTIYYGNVQTTTSSGTLSSTNQYDQIDLLCIVANTTFVVRSSIGNIKYQ